MALCAVMRCTRITLAPPPPAFSPSPPSLPILTSFRTIRSDTAGVASSTSGEDEPVERTLRCSAYACGA